MQALLSRHAVGDLLWPQVHPAVDYEGKESKGSEGNPPSGSVASLARYLDDIMVDNMVARGTEERQEPDAISWDLVLRSPKDIILPVGPKRKRTNKREEPPNVVRR